MWIAGRVQVLLSHYFQPDNPAEVKEAAVDDWINILSDFSKEAIDAACSAYLRDQPRRRPTPGDIRERVRQPSRSQAKMKGEGDKSSLTPDERFLLEDKILPTARRWLDMPKLKEPGIQTLQYWGEATEDDCRKAGVL